MQISEYSYRSLLYTQKAALLSLTSRNIILLKERERERSKQMIAVDCGEIYEILLAAYWLV